MIDLRVDVVGHGYQVILFSKQPGSCWKLGVGIWSLLIRRNGLDSLRVIFRGQGGSFLDGVLAKVAIPLSQGSSGTVERPRSDQRDWKARETGHLSKPFAKSPLTNVPPD